MSQNVWGPITWMLFHSFAEKINEEHFINIKDFYFICPTLPVTYDGLFEKLYSAFLILTK